jgi:hypothetical protein
MPKEHKGATGTQEREAAAKQHEEFAKENREWHRKVREAMSDLNRLARTRRGKGEAAA